MNQAILGVVISLTALIIALFALCQQYSKEPMYLKIEVEYGHGRQ